MGDPVRTTRSIGRTTPRATGLPTGTQPRVGAVFVKTSGFYGHVGVVTAVINATTFIAKEMNGGQLIAGTDAHTTEFGVYRDHQHTTREHDVHLSAGRAAACLCRAHHAVGRDTKQQKTAWFVGQDGKRRWIPTIAIYNCLKGRGAPGPGVESDANQ